MCNEQGICIICYHNDYGPVVTTNKVIDLSSYAFAKLAPLRRWVVKVFITLQK